MNVKKHHFDAIVVGAGHAGLEAALAASRLSLKTALITMDVDQIVGISCNPSIGGLGKSQIVMEIGALGGVMPTIADSCALQYKMLNRSKGMAVWALRAQIDKHQYCAYAKQKALNSPNLTVVKDRVEQLLLSETASGCEVEGVEVASKDCYFAPAVILATGTFLGGKLFIGDKTLEGGRIGEQAATQLSKTMRAQGFEIHRLKTGTPARIDKNSIDFDVLEIEWGDANDELSFTGDLTLNKNPKMACYKTFTNEKTHEIIKKNKDRSPLYSGAIEGVGPRYCPSIEDKVARFPDRVRHQLFLEPEGLHCDEFYVNGLSSCMPQEVQEEFIRTIPGLKDVKIIRYAYAVEYDYVDPQHLSHTLESKKIKGLFFAGQINGTSGYEEAAGQGLIAGINAAKKVKGEQPFILSRYESYIGVMIDDLVLKGTKEPYRMFTSRAENRLYMRLDNAWQRMLASTKKAGLLSREVFEKQVSLDEEVKKIRAKMQKEKFSKWPRDLIAKYFNKQELEVLLQLQQTCKEGHKNASISYLMRRGDVNFFSLIDLLCDFFHASKAIVTTACCDEKYANYVDRQFAELKRREAQMDMKFPKNFDFCVLAGLKKEAQDKLTKLRPENVGQAARVSGVTASDVEVLLFHLMKGQSKQKKNKVRQETKK